MRRCIAGGVTLPPPAPNVQGRKTNATHRFIGWSGATCARSPKPWAGKTIPWTPAAAAVQARASHSSFRPWTLHRGPFRPFWFCPCLLPPLPLPHLPLAAASHS
jgi:hypothetical protein